MFGKLLGRRRARARRQRTTQFIEALQDRCLLSAGNTVEPNLMVSPLVTSSAPYGHTPAQMKAAYGFSSSSTAGAGETIAIIDAYNDPNIASDLAVFDKEFGLAAPPSLTITGESGSTSQLPSTNASWDLETSLDVEWAHAIAPDANILLVEANSSSLNDLLNAVSYAKTVPSVATISMSWGGSEFRGENAYDAIFTTPAGHQGITFVAASGDEGSRYGPEWPASSPNVLAVGGTTLNLTSSGVYSSETTWSDSTGGLSSLESEPSYQLDAQITGRRSTPDVAYDANPSTGVAIYDSVPYEGSSGWYEAGGTSAGAPQWAALITVADSTRGTSLNGATQTIPALYSIYANSSTYSQDFNDITSGSSSGLYSAGKGYDLVTGLGTPKASALIAALAHVSTTTSTTAAIAAATSHVTVNAAVIAGATGSFAGVEYRGFDAPVDGIYWAVSSSSLQEPVFTNDPETTADTPDNFAETTRHVSDSESTALAATVDGNLDTAPNLSTIGSLPDLSPVVLVSGSQHANDVYPMSMTAAADLVAPPTDSATPVGSEHEDRSARGINSHGALAVSSHVFSAGSLPATQHAVHAGAVLTAVAGGIAVAALIIRQREPDKDQEVEGFIYNLRR